MEEQFSDRFTDIYVRLLCGVGLKSLYLIHPILQCTYKFRIIRQSYEDQGYFKEF